MKKFLHLFFMFLIAVPSFGQIPKPFWVDNTPFAPDGSGYIFVSGEGVDSNTTVVQNKALVNAIQKAFIELGKPRLTQQEILKIEKGGLSAMSNNNLAIKEIGKTTPFTLKAGEGSIAYVLIQVQKDENLTPNLYMLPTGFTSCYDEKFESEVEVYKTEAKAIQERNAKLDKKYNNSFYNNKENEYIAWHIEATYPLGLKTGLSTRHGGVCGYGFYASIGMEFPAITREYYDGKYVAYSDPDKYNGVGYKEPYYNSSSDFSYSSSVCVFSYDVGFIFYPYKNFNVAIGYGSQGMQQTLKFGNFSIINQEYGFYDYDLIENHYVNTVYPEESQAWEDNAKWKDDIQTYTQGSIKCAIGYNLFTKSSFILTFKAGASYGLTTNEWEPNASIAAGIRW